MRSFLLIGLCGGLGTWARYIAAKIIHKLFSSTFPISLIFVNLLGCFIIGIVSSKFPQQVNSDVKNYITIGFLGGFTTFSGFSADFFNLVNNNYYFLAFLYVFISVFFGLLLFYLGNKCF
jgi:fluoride exporter